MSEDNLILFPNLAQLYIKKAVKAIEEDEYEEAEKHLEQVLEIDPNHEEANQILEALDDLRRSLEPETTSNQTVVVEPDRLQLWRKQLLQENMKQQWETFDQMFGFMQEEVHELIETFLIYEEGDHLLKTKMLQECKQVCPGSWSYPIRKGEHSETVTLEEVPLLKEDWPETYVKPLQSLQDYTYDNPTVIQMGAEVWFYFLEKHYPFLPEIDDTLSWTAGLHLYTLRMITPETKELQLRNTISQRYEETVSTLQYYEQRFEALLLSFNQ
ncbi:hypothetical protein [Caldalkalibacillus salinus]|uniref:hypothetical protein n=1 Tax=Caldalkalibacillus salinus TaxID=2803787 RepID=UPI00192218D0|nr:hypothetical protein [Caldalkalibacillus salinus]